jgi:hypothetical protein
MVNEPHVGMGRGTTDRMLAQNGTLVLKDFGRPFRGLLDENAHLGMRGFKIDWESIAAQSFGGGRPDGGHHQSG